MKHATQPEEKLVLRALSLIAASIVVAVFADLTLMQAARMVVPA